MKSGMSMDENKQVTEIKRANYELRHIKDGSHNLYATAYIKFENKADIMQYLQDVITVLDLTEPVWTDQLSGVSLHQSKVQIRMY